MPNTVPTVYQTIRDTAVPVHTLSSQNVHCFDVFSVNSATFLEAGAVRIGQMEATPVNDGLSHKTQKI